MEVCDAYMVAHLIMELLRFQYTGREIYHGRGGTYHIGSNGGRICWDVLLSTL